MVDFVKHSVADPSNLPLRTISRYAHDLNLYAKELYRVCKRRGQVITVIGNSTLRRNYIPNDQLVRTAYESAGFILIARTERDLPANHRYLPIGEHGTNSMSKRMRSEVVITATKP